MCVFFCDFIFNGKRQNWTPSSDAISGFGDAMKANNTLEKLELELAGWVGGFGDYEEPVKQTLNPGFFQFLTNNNSLKHLGLACIMAHGDWESFPSCLQNNKALISLEVPLVSVPILNELLNPALSPYRLQKTQFLFPKRLRPTPLYPNCVYMYFKFHLFQYLRDVTHCSCSPPGQLA